jgi:hypothetical protein
MNAAELHAFTQFVDAAPQRRSMLEAFARLCALPKHIALQWVNFGYSLVGAGGFALFVRNRSIGSRGRIHTCFLESQAASGNVSKAYAQVFASVAERDLPDHEIVTIVGRNDAPVELRVGVSATALAAFVPA